MKQNSFINEIDFQIEKNHLLKHSFYKAWNAGELAPSVIKEYSAQYFKHVEKFPRYLSAIHSNCDDIRVRQLLLENLNEEEMGKENHPELWMRFSEGMGNTRENIKNTIPLQETTELVNTFMKLSRDQKYHIGLAAIYCYESMVPEIAENKIDGLKKFYGVDDENTLKFFTVHMHADKWHRKVIRKLLIELNQTKQKQDETLSAVKDALFVLNNFLSGMEKAHC